MLISAHGIRERICQALSAPSSSGGVFRVRLDSRGVGKTAVTGIRPMHFFPTSTGTLLCPRIGCGGSGGGSTMTPPRRRRRRGRERGARQPPVPALVLAGRGGCWSSRCTFVRRSTPSPRAAPGGVGSHGFERASHGGAIFEHGAPRRNAVTWTLGSVQTTGRSPQARSRSLRPDRGGRAAARRSRFRTGFRRTARRDRLRSTGPQRSGTAPSGSRRSCSFGS